MVAIHKYFPFIFTHVGCATLVYHPTLAMHTMHSNSTTIEDLILTPFHVDSGVGDVVEGQDTTNSNLSLTFIFS